MAAEAAELAPVRVAFLTMAAAARDLIARPEVAERWDQPSELPEMTVGSLAAHLARALFTLDQYLDAPAHAGAPTIDAVGYFWSALSQNYEGINSELQRAVRDRSIADAAGGHRALADRVIETIARLRGRLADPETPTKVEVLGGQAMEVDEYLVTRLVELLVHLDDLALSADVVLGQLDPLGERLAIETLAGVARLRHGALPVMRSLCRIERAPASIVGF